MLEVLNVPKLLDSSVGLDQGRWDMVDIATTGVNLLDHHDKVDLATVGLWQQDIMQWARDEDNIASTEWLLELELLQNSSEAALVARLDTKYDVLPELQQGGLTS